MVPLEFVGVGRSYAGVAALHPTSFTVEAGERFVLFGPSGSGKTTLLRIAAGLEPAGGRVVFGGRDVSRVPPHERGVGYLPARPALYPHLTVAEQLRLAAPAADSVAAAERLRVAHLLDRRPHQLSAGEIQRVSLAKIVARRPPVWLLDEPFAALDPAFRDEFRHDLPLLQAETPATILMVSHDPIDALALGRRVGVLDHGVLRHVGTPDTLRIRPGNRFVATALGRFSFLDGASAAGRFAVPELGVAADAKELPDGPCSLGFAPADAEPGAAVEGAIGLGRWELRSSRAEVRGRLWVLQHGRRTITVHRPGDECPEPGPAGDWHLLPGRGHWFGPDGERIGPA